MRRKILGFTTLVGFILGTCFYEEPVVYDTDAALPVAVSVSVNSKKYSS